MDRMRILKILGSIVGIVVIVVAGYSIYLNSISVKDASVESIVSDFNKGDLDSAIKSGESMLTKDGSDIGARLALAATYAEKGSVAFEEETYGAKAIKVAESVISIDKYNSEAYRIIGYANEIMENYEEARRNYNLAINLNPRNAQAFSNKGHSYDLQGNLSEALNFYNRALEIDPSQEHALLNKSRILLRQLKYDEAKKTLIVLTKVSQNERIISEGYQLIAFIEMSDGSPDYTEAHSAIGSTLSFDPNVPQSWVTFALIKMRTLFDAETEEESDKMIKEAKDAISKALKINPNQASAYYVLSMIAIVEGSEKESQRMKQKALDTIPLDITLGAREKESLRNEINAGVTLTGSVDNGVVQ